MRHGIRQTTVNPLHRTRMRLTTYLLIMIHSPLWPDRKTWLTNQRQIGSRVISRSAVLLGLLTSTTRPVFENTKEAKRRRKEEAVEVEAEAEAEGHHRRKRVHHHHRITAESSRMKVGMPDRIMVMEGMTAVILAMGTTGVTEMVTKTMTGMLGTPPAAKKIRRRKRRKRKKTGRGKKRRSE